MAENDVILVIDVGTTGTKAMLFDREHKIVASGYREYQNLYPGPMLVEQDPNVWWEAAVYAVRCCMEQKRPEARIAAVTVASQRSTVIPVDKDGEVLRTAILWQDKRCMPECHEISQLLGDSEVYQRTGLKNDPCFTVPKVMWLKKHQPEIYHKAYKLLMVHDFIQLRLTGQFITDQSHASRTMAYNINERKWDDDIITTTGLDKDKFCDAFVSGEQIGTVSAACAAATGLPQGTPVLAGAGDQQFAAVGLGVVRQGKIEVTTGTGSFCLTQVDTSVRDRQERILCSIAAVPGKWVLEAGMYTTGSVYRWFRDVFGAEEVELAKQRGVDPYVVLDELAKTAPVGSSGVLWIPHFTGTLAPYWDPYAKGVLFNLSLSTTRAEIVRAVLEGIAIEVNKNVSIIKEVSGAADEIRISGGAAKADFFNQIQADVYGANVVTINASEATSLGAAIVAAVNLGWYDSIQQAVDKIVKDNARYQPNAKAHAIYQKLGELHHQLYQALHQSGLYEKAALLQLAE